MDKKAKSREAVRLYTIEAMHVKDIARALCCRSTFVTKSLIESGTQIRTRGANLFCRVAYCFHCGKPFQPVNTSKGEPWPDYCSKTCQAFRVRPGSMDIETRMIAARRYQAGEKVRVIAGDLGVRTGALHQLFRKFVTRRGYIKNNAEKISNQRIATALRSRCKQALKNQGGKKSVKTFMLVGCSVAELRAYLENKFKRGMNWRNYGSKWHIDHIVPCVLFNLKDPVQQKACFHFSNLQPLWKVDNLQKGGKVTDCQPELLLVHEPKYRMVA